MSIDCSIPCTSFVIDHFHSRRLDFKAGKTQMKCITLVMAALHLGELVPGLSYCTCSLTDIAYWDT